MPKKTSKTRRAAPAKKPVDETNEEEKKDEQSDESKDEAAEQTEQTEKPDKAAETDDKADDKVEAKAEAKPDAKDRMARFRELQARAKASTEQNLKAAAAETQKLTGDVTELASLRRKRTIATHNIMKAEVEESGGDFERKRAWDWTAEESEQWDKRMRKKAAHRDNNAFQDYRQEAHKIYKRQLKQNLAAPDLEQYTRDKLAAVERAAAAGTLDIVETEDGELIAVDKDGTFFSAAESTSFADNRPSREAVDRLVNDQRKAEEAAARKKRERMAKNGDDADVTYINEKNKHFNQKLARFYNKYTAEIRESFERGTMI